MLYLVEKNYDYWFPSIIYQVFCHTCMLILPSRKIVFKEGKSPILKKFMLIIFFFKKTFLFFQFASWSEMGPLFLTHLHTVLVIDPCFSRQVVPNPSPHTLLFSLHLLFSLLSSALNSYKISAKIATRKISVKLPPL